MNYTAEALPILTQAAKAQAAGFASLGALSSFELIADDTLTSRVVWYRARYASTTVHFRFVLGRGRQDRVAAGTLKDPRMLIVALGT